MPGLEMPFRRRQTLSRRAANAAIHRIAAGARAIADVTHDAIITISGAGTITSANPAAERLYGWRAEELVGLLAARMPGYLVPRLAREVPGQPAKVTLAPRLPLAL